MTDIPIAATAKATSAAHSAARLLFIDNIRWSMIILVLSMHACDTYSPFGNWYYVDRQQTGIGTKLFFGVYQSFLQAFFMAALFFIAGYFSAAAYDRKGFTPFVRDRFIRLGLPTLLYMFGIGPITQYFLSWTWGTGGFMHQWLVHLKDGEWLSETGPMWFCAALLIFSVVYGSIRLTGLKEPRIELLGDRWAGVAVFIAVMAASTFLVRIGVSEGASVLNVHPGDFPQYLLMYAAGAFGYRGDWLCRTSRSFLHPVGVARLVAFGSAVRRAHPVRRRLARRHRVLCRRLQCRQRGKMPMGSAGLHRNGFFDACGLSPSFQHAGTVGTVAVRQCLRRLSDPPADPDRLRHPLARRCAERDRESRAADGYCGRQQFCSFVLGLAAVAAARDCVSPALLLNGRPLDAESRVP